MQAHFKHCRVDGAVVMVLNGDLAIERSQPNYRIKTTEVETAR